MKILVFSQRYYPESFLVNDVCESLVKKGHQVTVMTGLPNYPEGLVLKEYRFGARRKEVRNGVIIYRNFEIGRGKSKLRLFLSYLSYAISASIKVYFIKEKYDVVFVYQLSPVTMAIPAILYKKRFKVKILFYCLDLWPDSLAARGIKQKSIVYKFFLKLSRWIYRSADELLVSSSMFIDYFENHLNIKTLQINHLPQYAIEVQKENMLDIPIVKVNTAYNFVFAGNIGVIQRVETIIFAANELKDFVNISFHVIGNGSNLDNCQNLSKELKLKNIKFYGRKLPEEMPYFYSIADAMLVTLKINKILSLTLPGKIQSYMAFGKPIIGAIDGETKVVIQKASCGFTCEAEDYKGLARLITEFCVKDPNEIYQMGINSRKYYLDNFDKKLFMNFLELKLTTLLKN